MEIGIDSFAAASPTNNSAQSAEALTELLARIEHADQVGLDVFGIGEHHRKEFLDSAPTMILAAAATLRISTAAGRGARPIVATL